MSMMVVKKKINNHKYYCISYSDNKAPDTVITSYFQNPDLKTKYKTNLPIGSEKEDPVYLRKNHLATVISKKIFAEKEVSLEKYAALLEILADKDFQAVYGDSLNVPFLVQGKTDKVVMKKIEGGLSLLDLSSLNNSTINLSKSAIITLFEAINKMCDTFHIVHTDVHSGNIMLTQNNNSLVLTGLDKCKKYLRAEDYARGAYKAFKIFCKDHQKFSELDKEIIEKSITAVERFESSTEHLIFNLRSQIDALKEIIENEGCLEKYAQKYINEIIKIIEEESREIEEIRKKENRKIIENNFNEISKILIKLYSKIDEIQKKKSINIEKIIKTKFIETKKKSDKILPEFEKTVKEINSKMIEENIHRFIYSNAYGIYKKNIFYKIRKHLEEVSMKNIKEFYVYPMYFSYLKIKMLDNFKGIFEYKGKSIFESQDFECANKDTVFQVKIIHKNHLQQYTLTK